MLDTKYAIDVFGNVLDEMMEERGLTLGRCTHEEITSIVRECTAMYGSTWTELLQHVVYGDAKRERTLGTIRANIRGMYG